MKHYSKNWLSTDLTQNEYYSKETKSRDSKFSKYVPDAILNLDRFTKDWKLIVIKNCNVVDIKKFRFEDYQK